MSRRSDWWLCFLASLTVCLGVFVYGILKVWW